ncbi:unnamed protein product [Prorocentrum cordatum]|uniref:Carboxypeptidase n=1 Tax=Prorocentrum cordatum TaxID=2364126 RepID=A0ABN9S9V2_9DINO|nr:unnamed protein product [Polarella glacialis]
MFYWFVESQHAPATDPVILWTNGGPGCSGLGGFLGENGPFRVGPGGRELTSNDHAWNKVANMVFIEQPYAQQDFFISSESYGGHYMPTLAQSLRAAKDRGRRARCDFLRRSRPFRGIFLGNPLTYMPYRNHGQYGTAWGHQLLPAPLWRRYESAGCATSFPNITGEMDLILGGFDAYALDFDKCGTPAAAGRHERRQLRRAVLRASRAASEGAGAPALEAEGPYEPCIQDFLHEYLNREDVQTAIHVKPGAKWGMCSDSVSDAYDLNDVNAPMMPIWQELIEGGGLNIMIYSGDDDSVCATLGSQQFVWDLGYGAKPGKAWQAWKVSDQVAGFVTDFAVPSLGAFRFATVHGAGHMVPATQPARSLALLQAFLAKTEDVAKPTVVV